MKLLHVGCGGQKAPLSGYEEIGLDLDPKSGADLIGSMLDIPLEDGSVDGVYTSHTLEHVTLHDGLRALREFRRVIKDGGRVWIIVPNIGVLADYIRDGRLYEKLYDSPGGPVCRAQSSPGARKACLPHIQAHRGSRTAFRTISHPECNQPEHQCWGRLSRLSHRP